MRQAPAFWSRKGSWQAVLLSPLAWIYRLGVRRRLSRNGERLNARVICVGNLTAGGNGKTPMVIALAERLLAQGVKVTAVSRGYGGRLEGPHPVDAANDRAAEVGDEPLLLAQFLPVFVAKNRLAGCQAAVKVGAEVILLDDGFQDPSVTKDVSLIVVDAGQGFGNERLIPAGPLREPITSGLARADLVVLIGEGDVTLPAAKTIRARLQPLETGMDWTGTRVMAFAGIGRPAKFFATLRETGAEVVETVALGDHEDIPHALMQRLRRRAHELDAQLVTTEKDMARLEPALREGILTLPVRLVLEDWTTLDELLDTKG
jgi:tetraacyldisaccharide 4'-kinase